MGTPTRTTRSDIPSARLRAGALLAVLLAGGFISRAITTPPSTLPVRTRVAVPAADGSPPPTSGDDPRLRTPHPRVAAMSDAELTRGILGVWTTHHHGRQQIVNRSDGTASLEIEFDFFASLLYGRRMSLELTWRIERGCLRNVILRGAPEGNVARLISDFGNSCRYRMLELSPDRLLLQEIDDPDAFHVWTRVPAR